MLQSKEILHSLMNPQSKQSTKNNKSSELRAVVVNILRTGKDREPFNPHGFMAQTLEVPPAELGHGSSEESGQLGYRR